MTFVAGIILPILVVAEDVFKACAESPGNAEGNLQRRRVPVVFDCDDGLPGHTNPFRQRLLRHLARLAAQLPDAVGDARFSLAQVRPRAGSTGAGSRTSRLRKRSARTAAGLR